MSKQVDPIKTLAKERDSLVLNLQGLLSLPAEEHEAAFTKMTSRLQEIDSEINVLLKEEQRNEQQAA